ncbi:MAG: hypothetical protein WCG02_00800 [Candidatus Taylorbacteria bacterium]
MKKYPFVSKIATITGLALGAFALSALATGTWTAPSAAAPNGNVDAPINVGGTVVTPQYKTGALGIGAGTIAPASKALLQVFGAGIIETLGVTNLYVVSGEQTAGNVLTLDGGGKAVWAKPTGSTVVTPVTPISSDCTSGQQSLKISFLNDDISSGAKGVSIRLVESNSHTNYSVNMYPAGVEIRVLCGSVVQIIFKANGNSPLWYDHALISNFTGDECVGAVVNNIPYSSNTGSTLYSQEATCSFTMHGPTSIVYHYHLW